MITLHIQKICKKVIKKIYNMLNNKGISGKACYPGGPTTTPQAPALMKAGAPIILINRIHKRDFINPEAAFASQNIHRKSWHV
jgi:hypothetical protein